MDCDFEDPTATPNKSQGHVRTERAEIAVQTEIESEPSGRVHRDRSPRRNRRYDSPATYYRESVRFSNCIYIFSVYAVFISSNEVCVTQN